MKSIPVGRYEAQDIDTQVGKVLRGLGHPDPPLNLDEALALMDLDRGYYSSDDDSTVREIVSRMVVAGKQIVRRPTILFEVIKKASLSALWLPDKQRILIDKSRPVLKHRWSEAHEIGHSVIPWRRELLLGDNELSLNPTCHAQMEAEANYASGQLLFLGSRFSDEANDLELAFTTVKKLSKRYGNTILSGSVGHHPLSITGWLCCRKARFRLRCSMPEPPRGGRAYFPVVPADTERVTHRRQGGQSGLRRDRTGNSAKTPAKSNRRAAGSGTMAIWFWPR